jgi:ClpP class serine protease
MSYPHILRAVFNSPWALEPGTFGPIFHTLHTHMFAGEQRPAAAVTVGTDPILRLTGMGRSSMGRFGIDRFGKQGDRLINHSARIYAEASRRAETPGDFQQIVQEEEAALPPGQILHIFGSGILGKHLSSMDELCSGGLSVDRIQEALRLARDDDKVAAVMLQLDTPGGICYGMAETAALVRSIIATKNCAAFCDSLTASAGYWCTCGADYFYLTPSSDVGSIGVYSAFVNYVEWCKKAGIEVQLVTDGGTYKGAGYPGTALTPEQLANIKAEVMSCSQAFHADVRLGRAGVGDATMQGQCFTGQAAVDAKLADALVNDLEDALADLAKTV